MKLLTKLTRKTQITPEIYYSLLMLSLAGISIASYVLYTKITGEPIVCNLTGSCSTVNESEYAYLLSLPISAWGLAYYLICFELLIIKRLVLFLYISVFGLLFSAYLTFIEAFVLNAWCQWCIFSAIVSFLLFFIAFMKRSEILNEEQTRKK